MERRRQLYLLALCLLLAGSAWAVSPQTSRVKTWIEAVADYKAGLNNNKSDLPYQTEVVKARSQAKKISLDITGVENIILYTWGSEDGNDFDHAVWADARFVAKDGSYVWLNDIKPLYKKSGWDGIDLLYDKNVNGNKVSINGKSYTHTVWAHAHGMMIVPLNKKFVRFESEVGIDDVSPSGTVIFKVLNCPPLETVEALKAQYPQELSDFATFAGTDISLWLISDDAQVEKQAAGKAVDRLSKKDYFAARIAALDKETDKQKQLVGYLEVYNSARKIAKIQDQLAWLNVKAVEEAFADMKQNKAFDAAALQPKLDELKQLASAGFDNLYKGDETAISQAEKALALKREILMANPLLDFDKIIVGRYKMSNARSASAPSLGTQPNNWSNQSSASRSGFDAEIAELSNLRGDIKVRTIFKPDNGSSVPDLNLHWDADRILFTMADEDRRWQVYEVGVDGQNLHRVTNSPEKDIEFFDATYLPNGKILTVNNLGYHGVPCVSGADEVGNFCLYDPETGDMRRLTFDQDANWGPTLMNNGRVMYTRWEYTDLTHYFSRIVMHMNPDGTEQKALFGSGIYFPNSTFDIKPLPGHASKFIGVISGHHGVARSGRLFLFDPSIHRKSISAMQELPYKDREIIPLVKDELVNGVWPQFLKPFPLDDHYFLVTAKLSPDALWGIYLVDTHDNLTLVAEYEGEGLIHAIPLKKQQMPPVIPDRVNLKSKEATVFIQDLYEGEGLLNVPRGTVKDLRIFAYEYAYQHSPSDHTAQGIQSGWDIKRLLGTVPVEEDGSVMFKIPANTPISIQPLDSEGRAIQWMRSWTTGMPGETVSCVGCHEDQNQIPIPKRVIASTKAPQTIQAPEGGVRSFTFDLEIQPILDRACIACHNGKSPKADFTAGRTDKFTGFGESYLALHPYIHRQGPEAEVEVMKPYEYHASTSPLVALLKNGHYGVELTDKEWKTLYNWIDFNAPYHGKFQANPRNGIDQIARRIELNNKYANGAGVDWQGEIKAYADYLASQPKPEPVMPKQETKKYKEVKVKGWPFDATIAKAMLKEEGETTKTIELAPGIKMTFVRIPAGQFVMGSNRPNTNYAPAHKAKIDKAFWMAEMEVSNEQFRAIFPNHSSQLNHQQWKDHVNGGYEANRDEQPAIRVSWNEAMEYCKKLSEKTGLHITLPTETQWEWACRAGSAEDFWYGTLNDDFSKYENMGDIQLEKLAVSGVDPQPMSMNNPWRKYYTWHPKEKSVDDGKVMQEGGKQYAPNAWGLYDMHGNVEEWTRSDYLPYDQKKKDAVESTEKVVRGGSWIDHPKTSTSLFRRAYLPHQKVYHVGFRVLIED